jgi:N-acetylglutamate synthase-like GNAT family acetyltransferase
MDVRAYSPDFRAQCLALFDSNTPHFLAPRERADFAAFLDASPEHYFLLDHDGAIVACGGWDDGPHTGLVTLRWGMVQSEFHGNGIGRYLLLYRLRELAKQGAQRVHLQTSQHTAGFFEKQGFKTQSVTKDGFGPGIDRVELTMKLTVCP